MSIPLVQEATKDAINTSIIAIKRNIERINMLLGLVDNDSPDLSGLATKQELQDAVNSLQPVDEVALNNMQSVTSNAVAKAGSYSTEEHFTGMYFYDGKKIYSITFYINDMPTNAAFKMINLTSLNVDKPVKYEGTISRHSPNGHTFFYSVNQYESADYFTTTKYYLNPDNSKGLIFNNKFGDAVATTTDAEVTFYYTKTTD